MMIFLHPSKVWQCGPISVIQSSRLRFVRFAQWPTKQPEQTYSLCRLLVSASFIFAFNIWNTTNLRSWRQKIVTAMCSTQWSVFFLPLLWGRSKALSSSCHLAGVFVIFVRGYLGFFFVAKLKSHSFFFGFSLSFFCFKYFMPPLVHVRSDAQKTL